MLDPILALGDDIQRRQRAVMATVIEVVVANGAMLSSEGKVSAPAICRRLEALGLRSRAV